MTSYEVDPIIEVLADPEIISRQAALLFRFHRPAVEAFSPSGLENDLLVADYSTRSAVFDALLRRSISPQHSRVLSNEAVRLVQAQVPNWQSIEQRRREKAAQIRGRLASNYNTDIDPQG